MSGYIGSPCVTASYTSYRTPWGLSVTINKALVPRFRAACEMAYEHAWKPKRIDSYVCRKIRGSDSYSRHAYAAAFDFFDKPYPQPVDVWGPTNAPPQSFAGIFKSYGFIWGGDWGGRADHPHIEWSSSRVPALEKGDWFSMATKRELRQIVKEVVQNQVPKLVGAELSKHQKRLAVGKVRAYNSDKINLKSIHDKL